MSVLLELERALLAPNAESVLGFLLLALVFTVSVACVIGAVVLVFLLATGPELGLATQTHGGVSESAESTNTFAAANPIRSLHVS